MGIERDAPLRRLAFIIEYEGTAYRGSQWQKQLPTIQGELERAIREMLGQPARVALAGRTDAGVHAQGQVFSFATRASYPPTVFIRALNARLPADIALQAGAEVPLDFDVRRWARSRVYVYTICSARYPSPLWRRFAWQVAGPLDIGAMEKAAGALLGHHNFAAFAPPLALGESAWRIVLWAEVGRSEGRVLLTIEADAFLHQQMRRTAGALVRVGRGEMTAAEFAALVDDGRPNLAGPVAPPGGLCLVRVNYAGGAAGPGGLGGKGVNWEM